MSNNTTQRSLSTLSRILMGPPGWVLIPLIALVGLIVLNDRSMPGGGPFELIILGLALALGTAVVWIPRFVVALLRSDRRPGLRKHWIRWAAGPLMAVAVVGLVHFDLPFTARFALSEASLERFAQTVASGPESAKYGDQWVGLYPLTSVQRIEGGARFLVSGTGFLDHYGFAWSPKGMPADETHTGYTHIEGPWYVWESRL
jgi:hypothetical protein